jgi:hypothetical protein
MGKNTLENGLEIPDMDKANGSKETKMLLK